MAGASIWKRLLWKEFREGWQVVLFTVVAPAVLFSVAGRIPSYLRDYSILWGIITVILKFSGAAGVHLMIALWAAAKGGSRRSGNQVAGHLPVSPTAEWSVSVLLPVLALGILGLWFGLFASRVVPGIYTPGKMILAGALDLAATYAICYFIALIVSTWAAVLFGLFRMVGGTLLSVLTLRPMLEPDAVRFVAGITLGGVVAAFLFFALSQKRSLGFRQGFSLLVMIIFAFGPALFGVDIESMIPDKFEYKIWGGSVMSPDGLLTVEWVLAKTAPEKVSFKALNRLTNMTRTRSFESETCLLGASDRRTVYLAQQRPAESSVRVLRWDVQTGDMKAVSVLNARPGVILQQGSRLSPNSRYTVLILRSVVGNGLDVWVVDLQTGGNGVVIPCAPLRQLRGNDWVGNKVILAWQEDRYGEYNLLTTDVVIDAEAMKVTGTSESLIPFAFGGKR
ncbi:MAG: hypothetical protein HYX78_08955 [Armatimonadetes bacterium]|nr:hypothetical protein [Armatimonadota bacterium]